MAMERRQWRESEIHNAEGAYLPACAMLLSLLFNATLLFSCYNVNFMQAFYKVKQACIILSIGWRSMVENDRCKGVAQGIDC